MATTILKIEGGIDGIVYLLGDGHPISDESTNITNTLSSMSLTISYGYQYIRKSNGERYTYVNNGGGQWRKITTGPA